jgi:HlyD family secretion protein
MANPNSKKRKRILVFSLIALALVALTVIAIVRKREVVIRVQTEKVARRNITELVPANGRIQPVLQVKISPEVSGEIIELPVKEGQQVKKGDLLLRIKPDFYAANRNQSEASYKGSRTDQITSEANLRKAEAEFKRNEELFNRKLISDSIFLEVKTAYEVAQATLQSAVHRVEMSKAMLARAEEELAKTTIVSPLTGTVSKLNSEKGERVVGTAQMAGTEVMTIADLNEMEARVDIGEIDVILIAQGQNVRLEVDAFKDRKFTGTVTEIANSSRGAGQAGGGGGGQQQEATRFEVKIRIKEKEAFRPGMSVTAEIETRSRTNVIAAPIQSVTVRLPKEPPGGKKADSKSGPGKSTDTTNASTATASATTNSAAAVGTNAPAAGTTNTAKSSEGKKAGEAPKPIEVVFVTEGDHVKMVPVKLGISDDSFMEILEGLQEDVEIVSGGYKAISRDLEDGKKFKKGGPDDRDKGKK